jgi:hypothetical protein
VSHKDGDTKHAQDYRDDFNHFDAPLLLVRLIADPVFTPASSGPEKDHRSSYRGLSARWWAVRGSKPEAEPAAAGDTSPVAKPLVFHDALALNSTRRLRSAGFPFGFGMPAEPLTQPFILALFGRGLRRLPHKSGGPPPLKPSLNVQGDDTHNNSSDSTPNHRQFPGVVRMTMGATVFRKRIELIFRRC